MSELRTVERSGVRHIVLNRPAKRNALSFALLDELREALSSSEALRAVVISGEGQAFSAGADIDELKGTPEDAAFDDAVAAAGLAARRSPVPVFAAIEGACVGAALDLALACDVRVASNSSFFQLPALHLGLLYNPAAILRLRSLLPRSTLTRLLLLGERIEASAALEAGIATHVVPAGKASDTALALAEATAQCGRQALAATKALLVSLDEGGTDLSPFMEMRRSLLGSQERQQALARARRTSAPQ